LRPKRRAAGKADDAGMNAMTSPAGSSAAPDRTPGRSGGQPPGAPRPGSPRLWIALIALSAFAVEMAVSARYGYVRDELYFLAAGQHPAIGYVDQPALTPLLARLAATAGGGTLAGFRVLPAWGCPSWSSSPPA
jgi:hypothetical protein